MGCCLFRVACAGGVLLCCLQIAVGQQLAAPSQPDLRPNAQSGDPGFSFFAETDSPNFSQSVPSLSHQPCCDLLPVADCPALSLYGNADVLALWRTNSARFQSIVIDGATGGALVTTDNMNFDLEPGARFVLGITQSSDRAIEVSYFGLQNWNASTTATGDNNLRIPGDIGLASLDFLDADRMVVSYWSNLHNAEINRVLSFGPLTALWGFRYVHIGEHFNIQATDIDTGTSDYSIHTQNDLFGGQIGLKLKEYYSWFWLEAGSKVGVFGNSCQQQTFLGDVDNSYVLVLRDF